MRSVLAKKKRSQMAEVVVIGAADAEVGMRKLRAAGCDVMWVKTEKRGQLQGSRNKRCSCYCV